MKRLLIFLLLSSAFKMGLYAQCDVGIQVQANSFDINVKTPQAGSTYSWSTDNGQSGSGTTFSIPLNSTGLTIFRDGAPATKIPIDAVGACNQEIGGFTFTKPDACQSCIYKFFPTNNNVISHLWNFGDNTPTSTELMPTHTYSASGTYTVTHTVVFSTNGGGIGTSVCTQTITVVCGSSSQVVERVECCRLYLRLCGNNQGSCTHIWEVLNASNQIVLSSTETSPEFVLSNINTYNNNNITIRHRTTCNGVTNVESFPYTIQSQGIFVGNPTQPATTVVQYSTVSGPLNNNQPLFPALTVTNQNIYIQNVLEINVTPVRFDRDQVCLANDAGIDVAVNKTFNVRSANKMYNGCTNAWRGILVKGRLDMNGASGNNEVKGAVFAVRPDGNSAYITLVRTNFNQNFISLFANSAFTSYIQNNRFVGGSLPPLGSTSIAVVSSETGGYSQTGAFAGVFIKGILFSNTYNNQFTNISNGYYLVNTYSTITNNQFGNTNLNNAYLSGRTGHGIYFRHDGSLGLLTAANNYFGTLETAIRAISATPGTRVIIGGSPGTTNNTGNVRYGFMLEQKAGGRFNNSAVSHNNFVPNDPFNNSYAVDCRIVGIGFRCDPGASQVSNVDIFNNNVGIKQPIGDCILLEGPNAGTGNITVRNNNVSLHHTGGRSGIHLLNFKGAQVKESNVVNNKYIADVKGIWLENSTGNTINGNTVNGYLDATALVSRGILLDNSPSNVVSNNNIYNSNAALYFNGDCSAENQIGCNHFYNSLYGMLYTDLGRTGNQFNTGNRWESAGYNPGGTLIGARHDSKDKDFVQKSIFNTLQGTSTQYPRSFELQPGILPSDWFVLGSDAACGPTPPKVISDGETQAAGLGIPTGNSFEAGYNWISRRLLYRKLKETPALASSNTTVQNFYQSASSTNVGAYDHVDERLMTTVPLSTDVEGQLQMYQSTADNAAAVMAVKEDAIWNSNPSEAQLVVLLGEFNTAANDYASAATQINTLLASWRSSVGVEIDGAGAENTALGSVQTWESREKALNDFWLGKVRNGQWLTGADLAFIRQTAEMCPWDGGLGVYKARALWQTLSDETLTPSNCAGTYREGTKQEATTGFRLYPNPAQEQVVLELPAEWTRNGAVQLRLYNSLGALAYNGTGTENVETVFVPLTGLPDGLYVFQVLRNGEVLGTSKLSIVKN